MCIRAAVLCKNTSDAMLRTEGQRVSCWLRGSGAWALLGLTVQTALLLKGACERLVKMSFRKFRA